MDYYIALIQGGGFMCVKVLGSSVAMHGEGSNLTVVTVVTFMQRLKLRALTMMGKENISRNKPSFDPDQASDLVYK